MEKKRKKQVNVYLDEDLLKKAQFISSCRFMKFNAYISSLILSDLNKHSDKGEKLDYEPANEFGEDLQEEQDDKI
jgi:sensor histidine kinase regulating citrate/malate metabolism